MKTHEPYTARPCRGASEIGGGRNASGGGTRADSGAGGGWAAEAGGTRAKSGSGGGWTGSSHGGFPYDGDPAATLPRRWRPIADRYQELNRDKNPFRDYHRKRRDKRGPPTPQRRGGVALSSRTSVRGVGALGRRARLVSFGISPTRIPSRLMQQTPYRPCGMARTRHAFVRGHATTRKR